MRLITIMPFVLLFTSRKPLNLLHVMRLPLLMLRFILAMAALSLLACAVSNTAHATSISGTYVGKGPNKAAFIQLVETPDGHLTGRVEFFILHEDGKSEDVNWPFNGVRDSEMVVFTIKPSQISDNITASGTYANNVLHLSGSIGGARFEWNFTKTDETAFRSEVSVLTRKGNDVIRASQRKELVAAANETARNMDAFAAKIDGGLQYFTAVDQRYHAITENMRRGFSQARSIYGSGQAAVARSQIYVGISQASVEAEQLHINVGTAAQNFEEGFFILLERYNPLAKNCELLTEAVQATPPSEMQQLNAACGALAASAGKLQNSVSDARKAFARVEQIWLSEHSTQERILQAANAAE